MTSIADEDMAVVVRVAPLVSIDVVIRDALGRVLVGCRNNEPARGSYFVPGGVIRKNETLDDAFKRILTRETGLKGNRSSAQFLGVYEHFYSTNRYGDPNFGTHYVVLGYLLHTSQPSDLRADSQHSEFRWMQESELVAAPNVHENTKAFFQRPVRS